jgi:16S rRNA (guanine966-N2)-methyltransferase
MRPAAEGPRITGGTAKGAKLFSVPGLDVRPATSRMRISLFEILRARLIDARVADLFAGTGCLGLEALSRGASKAVFCDVDPRSLEAIQRNLEKLRLGDRAEVRKADAFAAAAHLEPSDVVFIDPPYRFFRERTDDLRRLLENVLARLADGGTAVVEHRPKEGLGDVPGGRVTDERNYGGTVVTLYQRA